MEAMAHLVGKIIELAMILLVRRTTFRVFLDQHVAAFLDSERMHWQEFPDFVGALILKEISSCLALRTKYRAYKLGREALKRQAEQEEQDRAFCEGTGPQG